MLFAIPGHTLEFHVTCNVGVYYMSYNFLFSELCKTLGFQAKVELNYILLIQKIYMSKCSIAVVLYQQSHVISVSPD